MLATGSTAARCHRLQPLLPSSHSQQPLILEQPLLLEQPIIFTLRAAINLRAAFNFRAAFTFRATIEKVSLLLIAQSTFLTLPRSQLLEWMQSSCQMYDSLLLWSVLCSLISLFQSQQQVLLEVRALSPAFVRCP